MTKTIEVLVSATGEIKIDAVGFKGADCDHATRYLEDALGTVGTKLKKPEYHQRSMTKQQQRLGK